MADFPRIRRTFAASLALVAVVVVAGLLVSTSTTTGAPEGRALAGDARLAPGTSYPNDGVSPAPTAIAGATFDGADGYVLMFGGVNDANMPVAYTWSFVHNNWTNLTPTVGSGPSARFGVGMAYDAADGYVVLFGGCFDYAACSRVSGDTWTYLHGRWTNLTGSLAVAPSPRGHVQMVYDANMSAVILFGGLGPGSTFLNDTWMFKGGAWSEVSTPSSPPSREGGTIAYDPVSKADVLFGGNSAKMGRLADTWTFHGGVWTNITSASIDIPPPRWLGAMTYDAADGYMLLVNGYNAGAYLDDAWAFSAGVWSPLSPANAPPGTFGSLLVYDTVDGYVLFFSGGAYGGYLTSTLLFVHGSWILLINPPGSAGLPLLFLLVFPFAILVPVAVGLVVGSRIRARREKTLGTGFTVAPGEVVNWIPSGKAARTNLLRIAPFVIILAVFIPFFVLITAGGGWIVALPVIVVFVVLIPVVVYAGWSQVPREIGVVRAGVVVRRKSGELRVPWSQLQPGVGRPNRGLFWFQTVPPGREQALGGFQANAEQSRAIVLSPFAPPWVLTQPFADGLGIPAQRQVPLPTPSPTPASPGPTAYVPGLAAPPPYTPPPPPPPPAPFPPPPAAPLVTPPLPPTPPPGPPPGTVLCARCGQANPATGVVFCRSCGQRLRV
jgi:hypothetical protein